MFLVDDLSLILCTQRSSSVVGISNIEVSLWHHYCLKCCQYQQYNSWQFCPLLLSYTHHKQVYRFLSFFLPPPLPLALFFLPSRVRMSYVGCRVEKANYTHITWHGVAEYGYQLISMSGQFSCPKIIQYCRPPDQTSWCTRQAFNDQFKQRFTWRKMYDRGISISRRITLCVTPGGAGQAGQDPGSWHKLKSSWGCKLVWKRGFLAVDKHLCLYWPLFTDYFLNLLINCKIN